MDQRQLPGKSCYASLKKLGSIGTAVLLCFLCAFVVLGFYSSSSSSPHSNARGVNSTELELDKRNSTAAGSKFRQPDRHNSDAHGNLTFGPLNETLLGSLELPSHCKLNPVLFAGHSHVMRLKDAFCEMLGFNVEGLSSRDPCRPYAWADDNVYLDGSHIRAHKKWRGRFSTIFMSTWAWDMIHLNSRPSVVAARLHKAMRSVVSFLDASKTSGGGLNNTGSESADLVKNSLEDGMRRGRGNSSTQGLRSAKREASMRVVIILPHFHRPASHPSRIPCQTDGRVRLYSSVVEHTAFELREQWTASVPGLEVFVMDFFQWAKDLHRGVLNRTAPDQDFKSDGGHLMPQRTKEIVASLFQKDYFFCDVFSPRIKGTPPQLLALAQGEGPGLEGLPLIRFPRNTTLHVEPNEQWTSRPSCESRQERSASIFFWGNMRTGSGWVRSEDILNFRFQLAGYYGKMLLPKHDVLRHQLIEVLTQPEPNAAEIPRQDLRGQILRQRITECLNNLGMDENQTSWDPFTNPNTSSSQTLAIVGGNVEYVVWRRSRAHLLKLQSAGSRAGSPKGDGSGSFDPSVTSEPPETRVPTCLCLNKKNLLPRVQAALLVGSNPTANATDEIPWSWRIQSKIEIEDFCTEALRKYKGVLA